MLGGFVVSAPDPGPRKFRPKIAQKKRPKKSEHFQESSNNKSNSKKQQQQLLSHHSIQQLLSHQSSKQQLLSHYPSRWRITPQAGIFSICHPAQTIDATTRKSMPRKKSAAKMALVHNPAAPSATSCGDWPSSSRRSPKGKTWIISCHSPKAEPTRCPTLAHNLHATIAALSETLMAA